MANVSTMDTDASVAQALRVAAAGAEYIRFTAQGEREARNLGIIRAKLRESGCRVPLVADIHFSAGAAMAAALEVEKVRINPGNFAPPQLIRSRFIALLQTCRDNNAAIRIGVNHGSLSERIMNEYGDTPEGMVASCMEYLEICMEEDFKNVVISVKASNTMVMIKTVRLLVVRMNNKGIYFPIHLGVTEAGDGEDGRIKSAAGIGAVLADGIGDTIRISLSEDPETELPVARKLADYIALRNNHAFIDARPAPGYNHLAIERQISRRVGHIGGGQPPVVLPAHTDGQAQLIPLTPDMLSTDIIRSLSANPAAVALLRSTHPNPVGELRAAMHRLMSEGCDVPVIFRFDYYETDAETLVIKASADLGALLSDGFGDGIMLLNQGFPVDADDSLPFGILQAMRLRISRTEYISCPGCGRTLYDLQTTIARVKAATSHLKGLKIGIMGCIVNGPGEMADADYGYVGAGRGKISLYKGKQCVMKNIPEDMAVEYLLQLIENDGYRRQD
jgi:(E)-4-hydroxy-3-methylbut-2-enyl-diphosphate synthase